MIKAIAKSSNGRTTLLIGLSFTNLDHFRKHPLDTFIRIDGKELDLPIDITIFSGETEMAMSEALPLGPKSKVTIDRRFKN